MVLHHHHLDAKNFRVEGGKGKVIVMVLLGYQPIERYEDKTVNEQTCITIHSRLSYAVRKKHPENWFPLHDNAPAHQPVLVKDFSAKTNTTILVNPPTPSHSADFHPFPSFEISSDGSVLL